VSGRKWKRERYEHVIEWMAEALTAALFFFERTKTGVEWMDYTDQGEYEYGARGVLHSLALWVSSLAKKILG